MPNFDAIDELTYDFTAYGGKSGVIPEPSTEQVEMFTEMLRQVMPTMTDAEGKILLDVAAIQAKVADGDDLGLIVNTAVENLFSGEIKADEIKALPYRVQKAFLGWIVGVFLSPEA